MRETLRAARRGSDATSGGHGAGGSRTASSGEAPRLHLCLVWEWPEVELVPNKVVESYESVAALGATRCTDVICPDGKLSGGVPLHRPGKWGDVWPDCAGLTQSQGGSEHLPSIIYLPSGCSGGP